MLRIGLTGGIGSGKTTVAKIFELLQAPVYYADEASKRLYHSHAGLKASLKEHFGEDIYEQDTLNRAKLASLVFNDEKKLALLNQLAHPPTIEDARQWMQQQSAPYLIKEAALLFESGSVEGLHYIIGVKAPLHLRLQRAMQRDGSTEETIRQRMARQIDEDMKMRLCDFIIVNDEKQLVIPQVLNLHQKFLELSR